MAVFVLADTHLSLGSAKPMDIFGSRWVSHTQKIEQRWRAAVKNGDTVVIPGDVSWALTLEDADDDLRFLDALPGNKLLMKGNHDFWWSTVTKMNARTAALGLSTVGFLYNRAVLVEDFILTGSRGWYVEERLQNTVGDADYKKIVAREVIRLRIGLKEAAALRDATGYEIVVFLHFPPVFGQFVCREIMDLLHEYGITRCYYGHIHGVYDRPRVEIFEGISFSMISADAVDFTPVRLSHSEN